MSRPRTNAVPTEAVVRPAPGGGPPRLGLS